MEEAKRLRLQALNAVAKTINNAVRVRTAIGDESADAEELEMWDTVISVMRQIQSHTDSCTETTRSFVPGEKYIGDHGLTLMRCDKRTDKFVWLNNCRHQIETWNGTEFVDSCYGKVKA